MLNVVKNTDGAGSLTGHALLTYHVDVLNVKGIHSLTSRSDLQQAEVFIFSCRELVGG